MRNPLVVSMLVLSLAAAPAAGQSEALLDPLPRWLLRILLVQDAVQEALERQVVDWIESTGLLAAQIEFALDNGHSLSRFGDADMQEESDADFFHTHLLVIRNGARAGRLLGILGHAHEYDGQRSNMPNNFNLFTAALDCGAGCPSEYIPSPGGPRDSRGLGRGLALFDPEDAGALEKALRERQLLGAKEEIDESITVYFREVAPPRDPDFPLPEELNALCRAGERLLIVERANGSKAWVCYRVHAGNAEGLSGFVRF